MVPSIHTSSPKNLGGSSDENEKVHRKFLVRLRRAKKGVPKFFFVTENLKIVNFSDFFFKNRQIFEKRDPNNFSKKLSVDFMKVLSQSKGGQKHTSPPHLLKS